MLFFQFRTTKICRETPNRIRLILREVSLVLREVSLERKNGIDLLT